MSFSKENYREAESVLAKRRTDAELRAKKHTEEVYAKSEEIRNIDIALSKTGFALVGAAMQKVNVREKVEALKKENLALQARRREMLLSLGYPENYTDVVPYCPLCQDRGSVGQKMCSCMRELLVAAGYRSSGLGALLEKQSFDNFSLHYYDGEAHKYAAVALDAARDFAENFEKTGKNLLFVGGTGLGKTHLSTAIAKRAIQRGFDVVYETAQNIISDFEYDRFKSGYGAASDEKKGERYLSCDLLIIDDLGAELTNQFTVSALYNVINTRINLGKSTIINTNLGQNGLLERYDERITSRLFGEFNPYLFRGADIRGQK